MVRYFAKVEEALQELDSPEGAQWISIFPFFSQEELEKLAQDFDIPVDYLTDVLDADRRPRYEAEENASYFIIRTPLFKKTEDASDPFYITVPIGFVFLPENVITICAFESPVLELFMQDQVRHFDPSDKALFALQLLEQNTHHFLDCLKQLDIKRDLIEGELFKSSRSVELKQLLALDKSLIYFINSLSANDNLKKKIQIADLLQIQKDKARSAQFEEIIIDNTQALDTANMYSNILNGIMDAYGSIVSTNLNVTIGRLTAITIVLMVPTLIASFYGMNVSLPFEKNPYAFLGILLLAIAAAFTLMRYFQRRRMF